MNQEINVKLNDSGISFLRIIWAGMARQTRDGGLPDSKAKSANAASWPQPDDEHFNYSPLLISNMNSRKKKDFDCLYS